MLGCLALVGVYFLVPLPGSAGTGARAVLTVVGLLLTTWLIWRELKREEALRGLLFAMVCGVLVFAAMDYLIAIGAPGEFVGLRTRLDALYFALSTLATVGFGDVHAQGQTARALLCAQMVFNVAVLATAGSVLLKRIERHRSARSG